MKNNLPKSPIAYFVSEYALLSSAPTYAGGLGVLAGDYLLEAAKEDFPFVLVSLRYRGYDAAKDGYEPVANGNGVPLVIRVPIEKREVSVRAWIKKFAENTAVMLLDTDIPENSTDDKLIANALYDPHLYTRIRQQFVLGVGGTEFFDRLGVEPKIFHINEGHTGLVALAVIAAEMKKDPLFEDAVASARSKIVFSKHTILSEAGIYVPSNEFFEFASRFCALHLIDPQKIFELGRYEKDEDTFSTTKFGIAMSVRRNAVSAFHLAKELAVHPSSEFGFVTNGVFTDRWLSPRLAGVALSSDEAVWNAKRAAKKEMLDFVQQKTGTVLNPDALTVVWARRFAAYKRPELLFSDLARLEKILSDTSRPVQVILSGKAHPADEESQKIVKLVRELVAEKRFSSSVAYIPDYSLDIAAKLTAGADLWLNTPIRGFEACGTSGMKAGLNFALMCSISDGWVDEVDWTGAGWILPRKKLLPHCTILEHEIAPAFYRRNTLGMPLEWLARIKKTRDIIESQFSAARMLHDYVRKMYYNEALD